MFHKYLNKQTDKAVYITEGLSKELETCDGVAAISKNLLDTLSCPGMWWPIMCMGGGPRCIGMYWGL